MKLYIVRHAESEANSKRIYQDESNPLSEEGEKQAEAIADRFAKIKNIDLILSSPVLRARRTAQEISKKTGLRIEFTNLAREREWPQEFVGIRDDDESLSNAKKC